MTPNQPSRRSRRVPHQPWGLFAAARGLEMFMQMCRESNVILSGFFTAVR